MSASAVAVIGAGGHGKVVVATLQAAGVEVAGIFDHDRGSWRRQILGVEVVGSPDELRPREISKAVLAIGDNLARRKLENELGESGLEWATVIHPSAVVHSSARVGAGTVVFAGAVVQPDTRIGRHSIVNTGASVDHDCNLGDFVHIAPGARLAGNVTVGDGAILGIGCSVIPGIRIGDWAVVGSGAAVVGAVASDTTVKGVPAR